MKVAKIKDKNIIKNKQIEIPEEGYSIKKILITLCVIVAVFFLFYFITILVVKPSKKVEDNDTYVDFDTTLITLSQIFDRKENEYYVLASKSDSKPNYNDIYNSYLSSYKNVEDSLKVYKVDLSDSFNKNYIGETNIADNLNELKLNEDVLFKIKDKRIEEHYIGSTDILKTLSEL